HRGRSRDHRTGVTQPQHGAARAAGGRTARLLGRGQRGRGQARDGGRMGAPAPVRTPDAEALRIFLRLIRPRPLANPYPLYARLRDMAPFLPIRFPGVRAAYLVSTFASCSRLPRDPAFGP